MNLPKGNGTGSVHPAGWRQAPQKVRCEMSFGTRTAWLRPFSASLYRPFVPLGATGWSEPTRSCGRFHRRLSRRPPSHADQEGAS
jgi:hypothetical protein